jgi:hypothetical protein
VTKTLQYLPLLLAAVCSQTAFSVAEAEPESAGNLVTYTEDREACADRSATRNAYFGDLHIHTGYSYDASPFGLKTTPEDAYRFAQGERLAIPPFDETGRALASTQLAVPLDFAAVTDHAEFFGEATLCADPLAEFYNAPGCKYLRGDDPDNTSMSPLVPIILATSPERLPEICGDTGEPCFDASVSLWQKTREMADAAYDRSSRCEFTTFVAYEYTGTPNASNAHRNVIFRNNDVPERAASYIEAPTDRELWAQLSATCLNGTPGCDVLAIPHNSNLASGVMFPAYAGAFESAGAAREMAQTRNAMEPVMEIFQHKGNSECFNGFPDILGEPDELCDIEQVRTLGERTDFAGKIFDVVTCAEGETGARGFSRFGCVSKNDFFRSALLTGLQDEAVIGVNSYRFGAIASTDTHTAASGATDERDYRGHLVIEAELPGRLRAAPISPVNLDANPGGLAGVWAVENSRDALFEALRRREVFGTSGTRIKPRLFGGWNLDANACELTDVASHGYEAGVPMGSDFSEHTPGANPRLLASAVRDPNGAPLQKLQIIKGWVDTQGRSRYQVLDIAGEANTEGTIDLNTGQWSGSGSSSLCAVFEDKEFDPAQSAYYYLRVVEVPTLRWSWAQCVSLPADKRPDTCENDAPKSIQELAWTSPIWYLPPTAAVTSATTDRKRGVAER